LAPAGAKRTVPLLGSIDRATVDDVFGDAGQILEPFRARILYADDDDLSAWTLDPAETTVGSSR
jgi:hypothetical protein